MGREGPGWGTRTRARDSGEKLPSPTLRCCPSRSLHNLCVPLPPGHAGEETEAQPKRWARGGAALGRPGSPPRCGGAGRVPAWNPLRPCPWGWVCRRVDRLSQTLFSRSPISAATCSNSGSASLFPGHRPSQVAGRRAGVAPERWHLQAPGKPVSGVGNTRPSWAAGGSGTSCGHEAGSGEARKVPWQVGWGNGGRETPWPFIARLRGVDGHDLSSPQIRSRPPWVFQHQAQRSSKTRTCRND